MAASSAADHHGGSIEIKLEAHLGQSLIRHRLAELRRILGVEEQEAAAPSAHELAAKSAIRHRCLVPPINRRRRHPGCPALLALPVLTHQSSEPEGVAGLKRVLDATPDVGDGAQSVKHRMIPG